MAELQASISAVQGFRVAGISAGLKANNALDFALIVSDTPCVAAGVFTTNTVKAAPVIVDMQRLRDNAGDIRAVAINTKSANACTGRKGIQDAETVARWTAEALNCDEQSVLVMSTGVIGTHLALDKLKVGVQVASAGLGDDWQSAAKAIMTTDTRPKLASIDVETADGRRYTVAGIAKGAGMIAPNMATMLSVIVTDAAATLAQTEQALRSTSQVTFNRIVVDGDMSTNDTVVMMANGASGVTLSAEDEAQFNDAVMQVSRKLAQDIVRDGEGVTKFITLQITGATTAEDARQIANTIATSPLVKTAFYGSDANWGRMIAAAGRAGVAFDPDLAQLWIGGGEQPNHDLLLFAHGIPTEYAEADAQAIMQEASIAVLLDCGLGDGEATVWTCDLSHEYVNINGDYRS